MEANNGRHHYFNFVMYRIISKSNEVFLIAFSKKSTNRSSTSNWWRNGHSFNILTAKIHTIQLQEVSFCQLLSINISLPKRGKTLPWLHFSGIFSASVVFCSPGEEAQKSSSSPSQNWFLNSSLHSGSSSLFSPNEDVSSLGKIRESKQIKQS